jgi:hypothetical protein
MCGLQLCVFCVWPCVVTQLPPALSDVTLCAELPSVPVALFDQMIWPSTVTLTVFVCSVMPPELLKQRFPLT